MTIKHCSVQLESVVSSTMMANFLSTILSASPQRIWSAITFNISFCISALVYFPFFFSSHFCSDGWDSLKMVRKTVVEIAIYLHTKMTC